MGYLVLSEIMLLILELPNESKNDSKMWWKLLTSQNAWN